MGSQPYERHDFYFILHESSPRSVIEMDSKPYEKHCFLFEFRMNPAPGVSSKWVQTPMKNMCFI